jgi:hypothetical protein
MPFIYAPARRTRLEFEAATPEEMLASVAAWMREVAGTGWRSRKSYMADARILASAKIVRPAPVEKCPTSTVEGLSEVDRIKLNDARQAIVGLLAQRGEEVDLKEAA